MEMLRRLVKSRGILGEMAFVDGVEGGTPSFFFVGGWGYIGSGWHAAGEVVLEKNNEEQPHWD